MPSFVSPSLFWRTCKCSVAKAKGPCPSLLFLLPWGPCASYNKLLQFLVPQEEKLFLGQLSNLLSLLLFVYSNYCMLAVVTIVFTNQDRHGNKARTGMQLLKAQMKNPNTWHDILNLATSYVGSTSCKANFLGIKLYLPKS